MVRFLLSAGADQEHKTDEMHTALMEASMVCKWVCTVGVSSGSVQWVCSVSVPVCVYRGVYSGCGIGRNHKE